jgi:phosphomannomutase
MIGENLAHSAAQHSAQDPFQEKANQSQLGIPQRPLFGTDGIRSIMGAYPLVPDVVSAIGHAVGIFVQRTYGATAPVLVGRDTRASGLELLGHLLAGLNRAGAVCHDVGVLPTPAVSFLVRARAAGLGIVISASHNPAAYNGLKFFDGQGEKLSLKDEAILQELIADHGASGDWQSMCQDTKEAPMVDVAQAARLEYRDFLTQCAGDLSGLRVVLDMAHGAASGLASEVFSLCGAEVLGQLGDAPDGSNINDGVGSVCPQALQAVVVARQAHLGLAFDGDADRVIVVDHKGQVQDGDQILAALSVALRAGQLPFYQQSGRRPSVYPQVGGALNSDGADFLIADPQAIGNPDVQKAGTDISNIQELGFGPSGQDGASHCGMSAVGLAQDWPLHNSDGQIGGQIDGQIDGQIPGARLLNFYEPSIDQPAQAAGGIVGTVVSNLGLERFLQAQGIGFSRAPVGDRWIAQELSKRGWVLGGESCGHILVRSLLPTGDGLLAGLLVAGIVKRQPNIFPLFSPVPSASRQVPITAQVLHNPGVQAFLKETSQSLAEGERLLVRASGTEPLVRILCEGPDRLALESLADAVVQFLLGQSRQPSI